MAPPLGWFHEWCDRDSSLTHYTRTLAHIQGLHSPPSSAVGPGGPLGQRWSAGSTTNRRPDLVRGPSQHRRTQRHPHGERRELLLAATLLPGTAAQDPLKVGCVAAPDGRLPPTECSLMSGCAVDERRRRVAAAAPGSSTRPPGASRRALPGWCRRIAATGAVSGRRTCQHTNAVGGWTAPRTSGAPLTVARSSSRAGRCDSSVLQHGDHRRMGRGSRACAARERERGPEVGRAM